MITEKTYRGEGENGGHFEVRWSRQLLSGIPEWSWESHAFDAAARGVAATREKAESEARAWLRKNHAA